MPEDQMMPVSVRRVLVIDDSRTCRRVIRGYLASEGFAIQESATGVGGYETAREVQPDIILLDLMLPDEGGFDVLRRLKNDPVTRSTPVVFFSGTASSRDKARGLDLGAIDFISKPVDPIELRARVRAAMRSKYLLELLEERAHLDGLTGLGNRFALEERLETSWQMCRRRSEPLTVLLTDLDRFKWINDVHGHGTGDEVLRRTARILRSVVRSCDFVARYGGEEFVVVAPGCDLAGGIAMAERFRADLSGPGGASQDLIPGKVTASVGLATGNMIGGTTPGILMHQADRALYAAKAGGRDAVWYWDNNFDHLVPTYPAPTAGSTGDFVPAAPALEAVPARTTATQCNV